MMMAKKQRSGKRNFWKKTAALCTAWALASSAAVPNVALAAIIGIGDASTFASQIESKENAGNTLQLTNSFTLANDFGYKFLGSSDVTLDLAGNTLTADGESRIVINDGKSFTVTDSATGDAKGGIEATNRTREVIEFNDGNVTLNGVAVDGNGSSQAFVKMNGDADNLNVNGCEISNFGSKVDQGDSAITSTGGTVTINQSTFKNNKAKEGAAINKTNGDLSVENSQFENNTTTGEGGAIKAGGGTVNIKDSTFKNNNAGTDGGAIAASDSSRVTITGDKTAFTGNKATNDGGAIKAWNADVTLESGTLSNNTADGDGGAIFLGKNDGSELWSNALHINNGTISKNTAGGRGGGIVVANDAAATVNGGSISSNHASASTWGQGGGGIASTGNAVLVVNGGSISDNVAEGSGGGILAAGSAFKMSNGTVSDNLAKLHEGGGISLGHGTGIIAGGTITGNKTGYAENGSAIENYQDWGGGGIFVSDQSTALLMPNNTLVTGNEAGGFGGGVAACSTGRSYLLDTIAVYDNEAAGENLSGSGSTKHEDHQYAADNPTFMGSGYQDFYSALFSYVTDEMPGGSQRWTGSCDGEQVQSGSENPVLISTSAMGLTATGASSLDRNAFPVIVSGNSSLTHGGGILNNGTVIYGSTKDLDINIGKALVVDASKMLYEADGSTPARAQLVSTDGEGKQTSLVSFEITDGLGADAKVLSQGKVVNSYNADGTVASSNVVFDRRLTFDETNCTAGGQTYTYYVREAGAPSWMSTDSTIYEITVAVKKAAETVSVTDPVTGEVTTLTKNRFEIDYDHSGVKALGSDEALDFAHHAGGEAHPDELALWPTGESAASYSSFVNVKRAQGRTIVPSTKPQPEPEPEPKPEPKPEPELEPADEPAQPSILPGQPEQPANDADEPEATPQPVAESANPEAAPQPAAETGTVAAPVIAAAGTPTQVQQASAAAPSSTVRTANALPQTGDSNMAAAAFPLALAAGTALAALSASARKERD